MRYSRRRSEFSVLLALIAALGAGYGGIYYLGEGQNWYALGLMLLAFVVSMYFARISDRTELDAPALNFKLEVFLFIIILGAGIFLRVYQIDQIPPGCYYDEAGRALTALDIYEGRFDFSKEGLRLLSDPMLYYVVEGAFLKLVGNSTLAIRLASVIFGIATIVTFHFVVRYIFNSQLALIGTALLSVSRWHITQSRISFATIQVPLFELLAMYFLVRWARDEEGRNFLWFVCFIVIGAHTYLAAKLFAFTPLFLFVHKIKNHPSFVRERFIPVLGYFLGLFLVSGLLFLYVFGNPALESHRTSEVWLFSWVQEGQYFEAIVKSIKSYLLMFNFSGDGNPRHNVPFEPLLSPVFGLLFLVGLAFSMTQYHDEDHFYLFSSFCLLLLPGIISYEGAHSLRTIGTLPMVIIFAAQPLYYLARMCFSMGGVVLGIVSLLVVMGGLGYIGYMEYDLYFNKYGQDKATWEAFEGRLYEVAQTINNTREIHGDKVQFYLSTDFHVNTVQLGFLTGRDKMDKIVEFQKARDIPCRKLTGHPQVFVLDTSYSGIFQLLKEMYPSCTAKEVQSPYKETIFYYVLADDKALEDAIGLKIKEYDGGSTDSTLVDTRITKASQVQISERMNEPPQTLLCTGYILIVRRGTFKFNIVSEDLAESDLRVQNILVLNYDKDYKAYSREIVLETGYHPIKWQSTTRYMEVHAELQWSCDGEPFQPIPRKQLCVIDQLPKFLLGAKIADEKIIFTHSFSYEIREAKQITDVTADDEGNVYVLDRTKPRIIKYASDGHFAKEWGALGKLEGDFKDPQAIIWTPQGEVLVCDTRNNRLQFFNNEGELLRQSPVDIYGAQDLARDMFGNIFIADTDNYRIEKFDNNLERIKMWGEIGSDEGNFRFPVSLVLDDEGNVLVLDMDNDRVQKFTPDGEFLNAYNVRGIMRESRMGYLEEDYLVIPIEPEPGLTVFNKKGEIIEFDWKFPRGKLPPFKPRCIFADGKTIYMGDRDTNYAYKFEVDVKEKR